MSVEAGEQFQPYVKEQPEEFRKWIADQELSEKEKVLWNFHRWMGQETDLESGSVVDYRKYVAEMLNEDGDIKFGKEDLEWSGVARGVEFDDDAVVLNISDAEGFVRQRCDESCIRREFISFPDEIIPRSTEWHCGPIVQQPGKRWSRQPPETDPNPEIAVVRMV